MTANSIPTVIPHAHTRKLNLQRDPDRPILSAYGGIGLRQMPNGDWNGYGQTSPQDVEYLIARCAENGITRIYAAFDEEEDAPPSFDYIGLFISLAHEHGIEVYATQPIFGYVVAKERAFAEANPSLFTRLSNGELDTHMLSAAHQEVRRYKQGIFLDWIRKYPLDGLQLDFIRYPYYTNDIRKGFCKHGYDEPNLQQFRQKYGYDDSFIPACDDPRWVTQRADSVTQFIRELRAILKTNEIELPIGVFNSGQFGRADSRRTVLQDWQQWEEEGLVDEHCPMLLMAHGMSNLARAIASLTEVRNESSHIFGPAFLAEGFDTCAGDIPTPSIVRDAARRAIKLGCNGIWFCRLSEIEQYGLWPTVKEISEWSANQIIKENFEPIPENLLQNSTFEKETEFWNIAEEGSNVNLVQPHPSEPKSLQVKLSAEHETVISQTVSFRPIPYGPVASLVLSLSLKSEDLRCDLAPCIFFDLTYQSGYTERVTVYLSLSDREWSPVNAACRVKTDFESLLLTLAKIEIVFPRGTGTIWINDLDLERDALPATGE